MALNLVATAIGGPEVLVLVDEPERDPGPGEVLLDVRAAGVNPIDYKSYGGGFGSPPDFPLHLGYEAAGVVRAVGADAVGPRGPVSVGDEVIAYRVAGAYAERIVAPASSVVGKPAYLEWAPASGLMLVGVTAIHALTVIDVGAGDTLLFHGDTAPRAGSGSRRCRSRATAARVSSAPRARRTTISCDRSAPRR